jgi:hypothetical protein
LRPKGSKDNRKRKVKKFLTSKQELEFVNKYKQGLSLSYLSKYYNVSKSTLSSIMKTRNIKCRVNHSHIAQWNKIQNIDNIKDNISGVYAIYFINKTNVNDIKLYIGSSTNIKNRLNDHIRTLKLKKHSSSKLLEFFENHHYTMSIGIVQECGGSLVLENESNVLMRFDESCLINAWKPNKQQDILPWLEKAITLKSYKDRILTDNGCWESRYVDKYGYAKLKVVAFRDWGPGEKKYFYAHRVAYWEKYGEYPELIRHKCGNSKCKNPDHLEKGNYRDNALDKRGNFPQLFEKKWLEFNADPVKLSKYFSDRWKANQKWKDTKISYAIYSWEKKLNLRKKYPEILDSNNNRRFSISYQKLGRSKKNLWANRKV